MPLAHKALASALLALLALPFAVEFSNDCYPPVLRYMSSVPRSGGDHSTEDVDHTYLEL